MSSRAEFEETRGFPLDAFQQEALDALDARRSVLVAAPTGSGKTVVAEYAVQLALEQGAKVFYTTPLKALSNQKYRDFVRTYDATSVGLLTGDNSLNGDAPIVVMTTEVLRNMIYAASSTLQGLAYVVLDEVHYLQDRYRGAVWEEVIVHLPADVKLVCLSATVSNAEEVAEWIGTVRGSTDAVIEERRPVVLRHRYLVAERGTDRVQLLPTFADDAASGELVPNPEVTRLDRRSGSGPRAADRARTRLRAPGRIEAVELLAREDLLPVIVFVFSRAGCDQAVETGHAAGLRLTTAEEAAAIRVIADDHTRGLSADDLAALGHGPWRAALEDGLAAHHAGMVPPMKEAVEEAFAAGLVKVVFATETLALGVNMPARSVLIEKLTKFTGERHEFLTPGEYTQLTGRAGRRGIDDVGYAIASWSPWVTFDQVASLASRRTDALRSSFRPTYNMAVNLVRRYAPDIARHLLNLSFAQFHVDRDVVAMERELARAQERLARAHRDAGDGPGDVDEYRRLTSRREGVRRASDGPRQLARALNALHPGDVVWMGSRGGKVVVLGNSDRRGTPRLLALSVSGRLVRIGPDDFREIPEVVARITLPQPHAPRSRVFQRKVVDALRRVKARRAVRAEPADEDVEELADALANHPIASDPNREARMRAVASLDRLERDVARLERRIIGRTDSIARQFDRVLELLQAWEYVDGWELTPGGAMLARLYTETDLLVAQAVRDGVLDGLDPGEMAAVVSCFTYERRGRAADGPAAPVSWPTSPIAQAARAIERTWRTLAAAEHDAGLPETRAPDPGFTPYVYEWVHGDDLGEVLDDELTGGDFVRHVKQCIDLLRQIALVAPVPATRHTAGAAAEACLRGVVAVASVVGP